MKHEPMGVPEVEPRSVSQPVDAPLTRTAIFLVATLNPGSGQRATLRSFCADLSALLRAVEFRDLEAGLSCVVGFGSDAWDRLFGPPGPAELHPFREIRAGQRHAVSTPGDLLFHIRAKRMDLCFEVATQIMARLGDAVSQVDEVHGFRYFDDRDLLGFVDGTENPRGGAVVDAALVGEEDAEFFGGSYVIVGIRQGTSNPKLPLQADVRQYPDAIAQALSQLRLVGVNGPYTVLLGAEAYTSLAETSDHGYPVLEHVKRLVTDKIVWAPASTELLY